MNPATNASPAGGLKDSSIALPSTRVGDETGLALALRGGEGTLTDVDRDRLPSLARSGFDGAQLVGGEVDGAHQLARVVARRPAGSRTHVCRVAEVLPELTFESSISRMTHSLALTGSESETWATCSCGWEGASHHHRYPRLSLELQRDARLDAEAAAVEEGQEHLCDVA